MGKRGLKGTGIIKGVLFDFDGTLTSPGAIDFPAIKREMGCPPDQPILEFLAAQPPERRAQLMAILEKNEEKAAEMSRPNKGAEQCLSALKERGMLLGVLTRNSLKSVEKAIARFNGIGMDTFDVVITRDETPPKPHPDGVLKAARRLDLKAEELLMVGDFRFDVMAGKAAGAPTVLLINDGVSPMRPGDPEPDFTITHLKELLNILSEKVLPPPVGFNGGH